MRPYVCMRPHVCSATQGEASDPTLRTQAMTLLGRFIAVKEPNIRCVLTSLCSQVTLLLGAGHCSGGWQPLRLSHFAQHAARRQALLHPVKDLVLRRRRRCVDGAMRDSGGWWLLGAAAAVSARTGHCGRAPAA
jgi:hypothetical protein